MKIVKTEPHKVDSKDCYTTVGSTTGASFPVPLSSMWLMTTETFKLTKKTASMGNDTEAKNRRQETKSEVLGQRDSKRLQGEPKSFPKRLYFGKFC